MHPLNVVKQTVQYTTIFAVFVHLLDFSRVFLADLVGAYKGLLKEKEALEATVKALGAAPQSVSVKSTPDTRDAKAEESLTDSPALSVRA